MGGGGSNSNSEPLQIILVGETGVGKSTLANCIFTGRSGQQAAESSAAERFKRGHGAESETYETKREMVQYRDRILSVVDTPGLQDTGGDDKKILEVFREFLNTNQNASAVLLVLNGSAPRLTPFHQEMFKMIKDVFGDQVDKILGVCLTKVSFSQKEIKKRNAKNITDDSLKESPIQLLRKLNIFAPPKANWFILDAEYDPDDDDEVERARIERTKLLDWVVSNPVIKTAFRIDLDQKEQVYLEIAKETGEISKALLELSDAMFAQLKKVISPTVTWCRKPNKEYYEYQPNKVANGILGVMTLGLVVEVDKVRLMFEATEGDGDDSDDNVVDMLVHAASEFTLDSLQRMIQKKSVGLRDFRTAAQRKDGFAHSSNITNITLVLCGTAGFRALCQAAKAEATAMAQTKMAPRSEAKWNGGSRA